jgi:membrane-bound lytic murein transglycosylase MltF
MTPRHVLTVAVAAALACLSLAACSGDVEPESATPDVAAPVEAPPAAPSPEDTRPEAALLLPGHVGERWTGDLEAMRKRKVVRALVTPSQTDFFLHEGRPRGLQAEALQRYEEFLNRGVARKALRVRISYVPVRFNDLIPALLDGRGDVAAAYLTITPEREQRVAFASGRALEVDEIVVTRAGVEGLDRIEDLSGRTVHVLRGSSYEEHLRELNRSLAAQGRDPVEIQEADPNFRTEDILDVLSAGMPDVGVTIADDFKARVWAKVLPNLVLREDLVLHAGGHVGWAVRKESDELRASLEEFLRTARKGTLFGNVVFNRYYRETRWLQNPLQREERRRLEAFTELFKRYGSRYGFDWLAIAAQAYQESGLDHGARSRAGAVGVMQLLPSTARDPRVGIPDISDVENNVHAGVKYMAVLRDSYFSGDEISEEDRFAFTWAAYNAGPAKVRRMRARAAEMDLDRNRWFQNVELAALAMVGRETVRYVANVYKYYVAYGLAQDLAEQRQAVREAAAPRAGVSPR